MVLFPTKVFHLFRTSFAKIMVFPVYKREVYLFPIWLDPPLLDYDFSLHNLVDLIVVIPTSPSSLKTKFVCIFYCVFYIDGFLGSSFIERL